MEATREQHEIVAAHSNGRRPLGSDPQTERLIVEVNKLTPVIIAAEKRVEELKSYIANRNKAAASGQRAYADESRDLDGSNLLHEEQKLNGFCARRDELEQAICKLHMDRLLPLFDELASQMEHLSEVSKPLARRAIRLYRKLRKIFPKLAEIENQHTRIREEAGRLRGTLARLNPHYTPKFNGADFPCSASDLQRKMTDGLRAYHSDARTYDVRIEDFPGLCSVGKDAAEGDGFQFDEPDEDAPEAGSQPMSSSYSGDDLEIEIAGGSDADAETHS